MHIDRRTLLAASVAALSLHASGCGAATPAFPLPQGFTRFPIWPGKAPGGDAVTVIEKEALRRPDSPPDDTYFEHVVTPTLTMLRPKKPNGAAMLLVPGGGYIRVAIGLEGYEIARRFAAAGYTCFILLYRLPADGWTAGAEAPLQDAQRALRTIRSMAPREGFDPARVGVIGFSAGGHLAAWLATQDAKDSYQPIDAIDRQPLGVKIAGLMYPVIMMDGPFSHTGSRRQLLGETPSPERAKAYSLEQNVAADAPPTFIAHAVDDKTVPVQNSIAMMLALKRQNVPVESHFFEAGGHGFGIGAKSAVTAAWPDLFLAFAGRHGV
ncbi:alpha/beta hydrolase [Sphingomonas sp. AP4-R1]|uniref:alpha/beta hydrolase n=1 Tax=Sphingomonas sp. AP4-R1 TaxID=2735134 RepID=UPI00149351F9|nr:alpha/beta hydrolase [Sphingomonas sp. AP4-R1]QJU57751.1 alpha/beta hydrolase [Sphingomonas sp. AP4-R1]